MNFMVVADKSFENRALLSGIEPIFVKLAFYSDSDGKTLKIADATLLLTDPDDQDFHKKNLELAERARLAESRVEQLEIENTILRSGKADTQTTTTADEVEAESPLSQFLRKKSMKK